MEKTLSQEERIRRAEEIYNRRRMEYEKNFSKRYINYSPKSKRSLKERIIRKMLLQVFICLAIYMQHPTIVIFSQIRLEKSLIIFCHMI